MMVTKISLAVLTRVAILLLVLGKNNVAGKKLVVLNKPFFSSNVPKVEGFRGINVIEDSEVVNQNYGDIKGTFTCTSQKGGNHAEKEPTLITSKGTPITTSPVESSSYSLVLPKCPLLIGYSTDTTLNYRYLGLPVGISHIEFEAKANHNVHIALSPSESSSDLYEIVIGGWSNTQSVIRRCEQCAELVTKATDLYLSANEFRWFWITFDSNGAIAVGRNDESTPFMKWTDPDPLDVQYLGYSTGFGSSGQFRFCGLGTYCPAEYIKWNFSCYKFVDSSPGVTRSQAKSACEGESSHLVFVETKEENEFLVEEVTSDSEYWIGIHGRPNLFWDNGNQVTFANLNPDEDDTFIDGTSCYKMSNNDRKYWFNDDCNNKNGYICEYEG